MMKTLILAIIISFVTDSNANVTCDFEEDTCGWKQKPFQLYTWSRKEGVSGTGFSIRGAHSGNYYICINSTAWSHNKDFGELESEIITLSENTYLTFWFHNYGIFGTLVLYLRNETTVSQLWISPNTEKYEDQNWHQAQVFIPASKLTQFIFHGSFRSRTTYYLGLDDIVLENELASTTMSVTSGSTTSSITSSISTATPVLSSSTDKSTTISHTSTMFKSSTVTSYTTSVNPSTSTSAPTSSVKPSTATSAPTSSVEPSTATSAPTSSVEPSTATSAPTSSVEPSTVTSAPTSSVESSTATTASVKPSTATSTPITPSVKPSTVTPASTTASVKSSTVTPASTTASVKSSTATSNFTTATSNISTTVFVSTTALHSTPKPTNTASLVILSHASIVLSILPSFVTLLLVTKITV